MASMCGAISLRSNDVSDTCPRRRTFIRRSQEWSICSSWAGCAKMPEAAVNEKATDLLKLFSLYLHRHATLASYSKGMKQRVLISAALLHDPEILIFDEPLSGLDVSSSLLFKHLVAELASRGKIILYISHVLEVVERICVKVIIIYKGQIKAEDSVGRLRDLMHQPSLEEIFTQLVQHEDMEVVAREIAAVISQRG